MKACVFRGPGDVAVVDMPVPEPGRARSCCASLPPASAHSDVRVYKGEKYAKPGVVPGHEIAGVIAGMGDGVSDLAAGEPVALCPIVACGVCEFCRVGKRNRCPKRITLGYDENGGLAEYVLVPEPIVRLGHVFKLPDSCRWTWRRCWSPRPACSTRWSCWASAPDDDAADRRRPMGLHAPRAREGASAPTSSPASRTKTGAPGPASSAPSRRSTR